MCPSQCAFILHSYCSRVTRTPQLNEQTVATISKILKYHDVVKIYNTIILDTEVPVIVLYIINA